MTTSVRWPLVEDYVHMRSKMNSNLYEISFWLKISLRCSICSLLVFTWIEVKWNWKQYGFHISHFDRNEISVRLIKYQVNTTQSEMPIHAHQNIGSFWSAVEMKLHMNNLFSHQFEISNRYELISPLMWTHSKTSNAESAQANSCTIVIV